VASEQGETATTAAGLQKLGGSRKPDVNLLLANQAMHSLWMLNHDLDAMWGVTLVLMRDIAPTDALEGMLTAQLVATHNLHMRCHRLAAETESPEKLKDYGNMAAKAGRSFCGLMTTLSRHRGKAPAQVRAEQVNVSEGSQAIVGVVNKSGEAAAAHAPATTSGTVADEPPMRSADPEANALQIAT